MSSEDILGTFHLPHKLDKLVTNYKCKGRLHCLPTHLTSFYVWLIGRVSDKGHELTSFALNFIASLKRYTWSNLKCFFHIIHFQKPMIALQWNVRVLVLCETAACIKTAISSV